MTKTGEKKKAIFYTALSAAEEKEASQKIVNEVKSRGSTNFEELKKRSLGLKESRRRIAASLKGSSWLYKHDGYDNFSLRINLSGGLKSIFFSSERGVSFGVAKHVEEDDYEKMLLKIVDGEVVKKGECDDEE